jgi:hypothetical protein
VEAVRVLLIVENTFMKAVKFLVSLVTLSLRASGEGVPFAPLETWKAAKLAGDAAALSKLYSRNPEAFAQAGKARIAPVWRDAAGVGATG